MSLETRNERIAVRTGRATRSAERTIRSIFSLGRNRRGTPSGPRYAYVRLNKCLVKDGRGRQTFIPSKTLGQYWKQEQAGSRLRGPYGLISGGDHPRSGEKSIYNIWSVMTYSITVSSCDHQNLCHVSPLQIPGFLDQAASSML